MKASDVLDFCFPSGMDRTLEVHLDYWRWMMRGGADEQICQRFPNAPANLKAGEFPFLADTPHDRLASILVFDQFPRSLHRDSSEAYAFDQLALSLALDGLECGHFGQLKHPWERTLYALPLVHAEGPSLRERADLNVKLAEETLELAPSHLKPAYQFCLSQSHRHKSVIDQFGRHPHCNKILGRSTTAVEAEYLERDQLPHMTSIETAN